MLPWVHGEIILFGSVDGDKDTWTYYPYASLHHLNWKDNQGEADIYGRLPEDRALLDAWDGMTIAVVRRECGRREWWNEDEVVLWLRNCKVRWLVPKMGSGPHREENPIPIRLMILDCDVEWVIP